MRTWTGLTTFLCFALSMHQAAGHGLPVQVDVSNGKLVVSGGLTASGYASQVFADPDPESWLSPGGSGLQVTTLPGFDASGLSVGESLFLEVLARPDFTGTGRPQRWLWHWSLANEAVGVADNDTTLQIRSIRFTTSQTTIAQGSLPPPTTSVKLADLLSGDIDQHKHMAAYFLDDSPPAESGAYGFFARVISPAYQPSDPFLISLNLNILDEIQFEDAARAINLAAGIAGDYDVDGKVDGADIVVWQRTFGATGAYPPADGSLSGAVDSADLAIWKRDFGLIVPQGSATVQSTPEPRCLALVGLAVVWTIASASARSTFARSTDQNGL